MKRIILLLFLIIGIVCGVPSLSDLPFNNNYYESLNEKNEVTDVIENLNEPSKLTDTESDIVPFAGNISIDSLIGTYYIESSSNVRCIKANFQAHIIINYKTINGEDTRKAFDVPVNNKVSGQCDKYIQLNWATSTARRRRRQAPKENILRLTLDKDNAKNSYFVSNISCTLLRDGLPDIEDPNGPAIVNEINNLREFETQDGASFSCARNIVKDSSFEVKFISLQFEAFNEEPGTEFKSGVTCTSNIEQSATTVGIAVGVSLGVLVLIAIGFALFTRYRKRRSFT